MASALALRTPVRPRLMREVHEGALEEVGCGGAPTAPSHVPHPKPCVTAITALEQPSAPAQCEN